MLWKKQTPTKSDRLLSGANVGLKQFSSEKLYKRLIWEKVQRIISDVQTGHHDLKWTKILDPWISRNMEYFGSEDIWDYIESPVSLCSMIYIHECMADIQDRITLASKIQGHEDFVALARAFAFFRIFDVISYFTSLYNNQTYTPLYFRLKTKKINKYISLANDILDQISFLPKQYIVIDFFSIGIRLFHRFRTEVLGEKFYVDKSVLDRMDEMSHKTAELDSEGESWSPPSRNKGIGELDTNLIGESPLRLRKYSEEDANHNICKQFLENSSIYERLPTDRRIMQRQAIQFCLTYLLHDCLEIARPAHKDMIQNALNIVEKVSQTTKRFWRLDPRSFVEYYEKSQAFYKATFKIYRDVIEFRRNSIVSSHQVGQTFSSYYLSYSQEKGYQIKHGVITTHKMENGESYITVDDTFESEYPIPKDQYVQVILPGFINLHTHTKYNFQGCVSFGTKFNYRFQWRQLEYEGKYVVNEDKILKALCSPQQQPENIYDFLKNQTQKCYTENDFHQFKKYVKMYTHLQSLIAGTTSIFMECEYQKKAKYPEIIRSTIIKDPNSKNITSVDLYVIWRNQKNKDNLVMIWSKDFIKFLTEVVALEIQILLENQKNRINLHVHLAEGKSDAYVTICQFDNFCYDIICLEHFIRHIRDRATKFEIGNVNVVCTSRIMDNFGVSIISAENADRTYRCQLQIKKLIVKSDQEKSYRTHLDMTIVEQNMNADPSLQGKEVKVKNITEPELTQTYKLQTIHGNLLIVHANGFQWHKPLHRYLLETYETNICVSPYSNICLYGGVRDFNWARWILDAQYKKYRKYLCLGTDWNPTGKENVLEQARYLLKQLRANNVDLDKDTIKIIYDMTTINPARVTKMSIGTLGDSFYSDFWIGKFPKKILFQGPKFVDKALDLIEYVLREFDYQNNIIGVYCSGQLVYSQSPAPGLQEIKLKNQLRKYFYNPEGKDNMQFQQYIQTIRNTLTQQFEANISLLFP